MKNQWNRTDLSAKFPPGLGVDSPGTPTPMKSKNPNQAQAPSPGSLSRFDLKGGEFFSKKPPFSEEELIKKRTRVQNSKARNQTKKK